MKKSTKKVTKSVKKPGKIIKCSVCSKRGVNLRTHGQH